MAPIWHAKTIWHNNATYVVDWTLISSNVS